MAIIISIIMSLCFVEVVVVLLLLKELINQNIYSFKKE